LVVLVRTSMSTNLTRGFVGVSIQTREVFALNAALKAVITVRSTKSI